ncbi:two-component sensor histidine kinase [Pasteurella canis]|uniref:ATP-binding protein n=1 Tax=Pasteurella canis TaxID=753 RepID=UPI001E55BBD8|nr:ATP-binding protein [Pasteurella canis]GJJ81154.1 two-component sensor histidine kinase [Pasteurella canis]
MKTWFKHLDLSTGLQLSFLVSVLLCLFVGGVGLYTWQQQRSEINFALDQDFPKVQAAFQTEEQINILQNAFVHLVNVKNTNDKVARYNNAKQQLTTLKELIIELNENLDDQLTDLLHQQSQLLEQISANITATLTLNEELNKTVSKINWLHNDFHNEFTALLQEMSWQQSTLANNIALHPQNTQKVEQLKKLQQELLLVYDFTNYEEQIITELRTQITEPSQNSAVRLHNYLSYLSLLINNRIALLDKHSSIITIQQILTELIRFGLNPQELPTLFSLRTDLHQQQQQLITQSESVFDAFRQRINTQIGNSKNQLHLLHNIVEKSTQFNGVLILLAMLLACIFVIAVNFFYIRLRLLKRFQQLNQAVVQLTNGEDDVKIAIYGNDELGRIAKLLRLFLFEMQKKTQELELRNQILLDEIDYRIKVQTALENTQNELTQAAKLAAVGKTLTSISHEITQPLNAMNAYLFSAKRAAKKQNIDAVLTYLDKINHLVERTALIVKRLRQFSRQGSGKIQAVNLTDCIQSAWELLETQHKNRQGRLTIPAQLPYILGEDVLIEQVFVNLFLNSLEAIEHVAPHICIEIANIDENCIRLWVSDNGKGWPLTEKLLQPFASSKSINLGLGLSISQSIMEQCQGELRIASTLEHNALIILTFKVTQDV